VAPDASVAYREAVDTLRAETDKSAAVQWVVITPDSLRTRNPGTASVPKLVVAVGHGAFASVVAYYKGQPNAPPIVATLLPRRAFERELQSAGSSLKATAVLLDQPPARQAALIQTAFPRAKQVGLLIGADSHSQVGAVSAALSAAGLTLSIGDVRKEGLLPALQDVLESSDVVLGIADPSVYSGETIASILTAGYRRRVPLVAFSPAYVKAGALLGLYTSPTQVGKATAAIVQAGLRGAPLPPPRSASDFSIEVNAAVARSMGFALNAEELRKHLHEKGAAQ
jgi:hypothetical protein